MRKVVDGFGKRVCRNVSVDATLHGRKLWGVNVWCTDDKGRAYNVSRQLYASRAQARAGSYRDGIGERGRIA